MQRIVGTLCVVFASFLGGCQAFAPSSGSGQIQGPVVALSNATEGTKIHFTLVGVKAKDLNTGQEVSDITIDSDAPPVQLEIPNGWNTRIRVIAQISGRNTDRLREYTKDFYFEKPSPQGIGSDTWSVADPSIAFELARIELHKQGIQSQPSPDTRPSK